MTNFHAGVNCETNINDCQSSPCHRGECIDGENSFTCNCNPGYTGYLCQTQINECESNPCQYGGHCEDLINGYQCRCKPGTSGLNCENNVNECYSNPCRNEAKCIDGINRWRRISRNFFFGYSQFFSRSCSLTIFLFFFRADTHASAFLGSPDNTVRRTSTNVPVIHAPMVENVWMK